MYNETRNQAGKQCKHRDCNRNLMSLEIWARFNYPRSANRGGVES